SLEAQQVWLQQSLAASTSPWKIVYFHQPPYSSASHGSHPPLQWPFKEWGADIVLTGHDHTYERLSVDDFPYIVAGLGGQFAYPFSDPPLSESLARFNDRHGALRVTASDAGVRFEFFAVPATESDNPAGQRIDVFDLGFPVPEPTSSAIVSVLAIASACVYVPRLFRTSPMTNM
ncbi:MAG: metallophosphoesterase, partial [Pirellulales bacterium]